MKKYYSILGIEDGSDLETIKKAYHKLSAKYHPDNYVNEPEDIQKRNISFTTGNK